MPDLTYAQLSAQLTHLAKTISRDSEALHTHAKTISDEADDTARIAEMIGALRVDPATVAETRDVAHLMRGVSQAATAYAAAGDTTAKTAQAAQEQNKASHSAIGEAAARSTAGAAVYDVERPWLLPE
ncbi:hypothetical protein [Streptomyces griseosporeus]|uniref:hypothetical protein n=1 Tax=Streptomyces griseosporeus TaxID=1910 RepID=UPI0036FE6614